MKPNIRSEDQLKQWLALPQPAVFQKLDIQSHSSEVEAAPLQGCAFIGCEMTPALVAAAAKAKCVILPPIALSTEIPFDPYTISLYCPKELYKGYDPNDPATKDAYLDRRIYMTYMDANKQLIPTSADVMLLRRMHDATVGDALDPIVEKLGNKIVAIMGGHDRGRADTIYKDVASLALNITQLGYFVATGGGPGLMEAANLGAYCAGFADPKSTLDSALTELAKGEFNPLEPKWEVWLKEGYMAWQRLGEPTDPEKSRSLGIPTWFYGHEPPNLFATDVAKYFENSIREEGLLAVALAGIIYAEGNGGTVQEIFQDACQNYYRTYGKVKSPMVLLGTDYWNPDEMVYGKPTIDKRKKIYPILKKLATEKDFFDYIHITDSVDDAIDFIVKHPPVP
jgi:predicted Rossmann-fold nucleotide-binding protein